VSYTQLAALAGRPKAQRAVGSALAANTIGYLIPCHRVIRESGESGHYRWGDERKVAMLAWEAGVTTP
jgi:AraC family transcriptional regulator of adaptative response/methylated-DNA-[protein]-cysteine methyltransferase